MNEQNNIQQEEILESQADVSQLQNKSQKKKVNLKLAIAFGLLFFIGIVSVILYKTTSIFSNQINTQIPNNIESSRTDTEISVSNSNTNVGNDDSSLHAIEDELVTNENERTYISEKFGISFKYLYSMGDDETMEVKELGNKIYVYSSNYSYDTGQYVEIFSKEPNDTLTEAIKKQFLEGYLESDCEVYIKNDEYYPKNYPENYEVASIRVTGDFNDLGEWYELLKNCPPTYTESNGRSFFLSDKNNPDKFLFFFIGQYPISASNNLTWEETVRFDD